MFPSTCSSAKRSLHKYLWEIGQYEEALFALVHAEQACSQTIGLSNLEAARIFVVRASVYSTQNHYSQADDLFQQALDLRKALLPSEDQLLANNSMPVGNTLLNVDRFEESIEKQREVIAIRQRSYHPAPAMMRILLSKPEPQLFGCAAIRGS